MNNLPVSSPTPIHRETLYSYLARLASIWRTDAAEIASDMGASFKRLLNQDHESFETVADWAQLTPETMDELLSWTGVKAGNVRMEFRGELYVSRALRNPVMRGCPVCLREDAAGASGPPYGAMAMRGDWQLREVTVCTRHGHPLVPLWQAAAPRDRFDIGARLREIEADIMSGALYRPTRAPSAYDLWLDRRLEDGTDDTWLRDHPVFVVTTLCRLLGQAVLREDSPGEEYASGRIHSAGFDIVVDGSAQIRATLDRIATISTGAWDEPQKAFGPLYTKLNRDYLHESGFDPFRNILRDCILDNWPLGPGDVVLGEVVRERLLHSLLTAKKETGIGTTVLEHFLTEAGAIRPNDPRPLGRRLFDAQAHAGLLAEIPTLVGPIAMRKAMGATKMELIALTEEGLLFPRTQLEKVKKPWRILDGMALVNELSARSVSVSGDDRNWTTLLLARKQTGVSLVELVEAVRNARLKVGRRVGVVGFHGIVVQLAEVDRMATPRTLLHGAKADDVPAGMAASEFARTVGLRGEGAMKALIETGYVTGRRIMNPRTGRAQYRMNPEDIASFHQQFVTLTTLSAETGQHRNTLRKILPSRGITPFSPEGQDFGAVYLRGDVAAVLR